MNASRALDGWLPHSRPVIAAGVQLCYLSRIMGTSVTQIDATYGHLVPDSEDYLRELLDSYDSHEQAQALRSRTDDDRVSRASIPTSISRSSMSFGYCLVVWLALTGCGGTKDAPDPDKNLAMRGTKDALGPDKNLAMIELGYRPSANDSTLVHITSMLDKLQAVCVGNSRLQLADATATSVKALDGKGFHVPPTKVLDAAVTGSRVFGNIPVDDCRPMFPILVRDYLSVRRLRT
jgi:hypothetical protein